MANQIAYGFLNLRDRFNELALTAQNIPIIEDAINRTFEMHNRVMRASLQLFTRTVTEPQLRYRTAGTARLQPIDENGRALPIKQVLGYYDVAWPLYSGAAAWGATWMERIKWTIEDVNRQINLITDADVNWMRDHIYSALFQNADWQADDDEKGVLTIKPLANGDAVSYQYWSAGSYGATDNHFLAQVAAIDDANNPFATIYRKLTEHPENGGDVVCFVPTNQVAAVTGLTSFHSMPDQNLDLGANAVRVVGGGPMPMTTGFAMAGEMPGRLLGYEDNKVWLYEWPTLPDNYFVAFTTDGERALGMREDPFEQLRGFREVAETDPNDYHPFWERQYFRRAGFGAWNRTGAVVLLVGSGTYTPPAAYVLPAR